LQSRHRLSRIVKIVLALLTLVTVVELGILTFRWFGFGEIGEAARSLPDELAAARAEGVPLEPKDIQRTPPVPANENAAPVYTEAMHKLYSTPKAEGEPLLKAVGRVATGRAAGDDRALAEKAVAKWEEAIALGERAAALPHCDFKRDYAKGLDLEYPEDELLRALTRLSCARAAFACDAGRFDEALSRYRTAARFARHVGEEPGMLPMLVRVAMEGIVGRSMEIQMARYPNSPLVKGVPSVVQEFGPVPSLRHMARGEALLMWMSISNLDKKVQEKSPLNPLRGPVVRGSAGFKAIQARTLHFWRTALKGLKEDDPVATRRMFVELDRQTSLLKGDSSRLNSLISGSYPECLAAYMACVARRRMLLAYVDLLRERRNGVFPERLPGSYVDPHDGQPLRYKRTEKGFVVYGLGPDFKDDGGKRRPTDNKGPDGWDLVLSYPAQ
jgi:hypothetical protein